MAPGGGAQRDGVIVRHSCEEKAVVGQLVPLLAGHLASLTADAERGVGEKSLPFGPVTRVLTGGLHLQTSGFGRRKRPLHLDVALLHLFGLVAVTGLRPVPRLRQIAVVLAGGQLADQGTAGGVPSFPAFT